MTPSAVDFFVGKEMQSSKAKNDQARKQQINTQETIKRATLDTLTESSKTCSSPLSPQSAFSILGGLLRRRRLFHLDLQKYLLTLSTRCPFLHRSRERVVAFLGGRPRRLLLLHLDRHQCLLSSTPKSPPIHLSNRGGRPLRRRLFLIDCHQYILSSLPNRSFNRCVRKRCVCGGQPIC